MVLVSLRLKHIPAFNAVENPEIPEIPEIPGIPEIPEMLVLATQVFSEILRNNPEIPEIPENVYPLNRPRNWDILVYPEDFLPKLYSNILDRSALQMTYFSLKN